MVIAGFNLTPLQFARDKPIGDSPVRFGDESTVAVVLKHGKGRSGQGNGLNLFHPFPAMKGTARVFENTFLEGGVHLACALTEVQWREHSFQKLDHPVETPMEIGEGRTAAPDRPGHGLGLAESARHEWARPEILPREELGDPRVARELKLVTSAG